MTVSAYELVSGSETKTANGTYDVTNLAEIVVNVQGAGGMNVQVMTGKKEVAKSSLTASGLKLTVEKTGTYTISWAAWKSSSSAASTRLYVGGSAKDTERTTWTRTYGQGITITGFDLTAGQTVEVYAKSGSTSRYVNVANLIIQQTA